MIPQGDRVVNTAVESMTMARVHSLPNLLAIQPIGYRNSRDDVTEVEGRQNQAVQVSDVTWGIPQKIGIF